MYKYEDATQQMAPARRPAFGVPRLSQTLGAMKRHTIFVVIIVMASHAFAGSRYASNYQSIDVEANLSPIIENARVKVSRSKNSPEQIGGISIWINGEKHNIQNIDFTKFLHPNLRDLSIGTYSVLCIEGMPCEPGAYLDIPHGDFVHENCEYSKLTVTFSNKGIKDITALKCSSDGVGEYEEIQDNDA